jgi:hypothetical protein
MRKASVPLFAVLALSLVFSHPPAAAQDPTPVAAQDSASRVTDRLFLGFAEEASVAQRQWWEGRLELSDGDSIDSNVLRGIAAFQPWEDVEMGLNVGFGDTETTGTLPDGSGATDLDFWTKWFLGGDANDTQFAVGGVATIPTGDDNAGLGMDAFSVGGFGSLRYHLPRWTFSGHVGLRASGDAEFLGLPEFDGETSFQLGLGGIVPLSKSVTLLLETEYEGERFEGGEPDFRALGGINLHGLGRGVIRAAVTAGLDDGAPDAQLLVGYAAEF